MMQILQAFIDAVRWGAATNADRMHLQAPFKSGVSIQDFQLDPLVRTIDMSRTNLLIADDVGLGKTIEAGLIVQEMIVRHRFERSWYFVQHHFRRSGAWRCKKNLVYRSK